MPRTPASQWPDRAVLPVSIGSRCCSVTRYHSHNGLKHDLNLLKSLCITFVIIIRNQTFVTWIWIETKCIFQRFKIRIAPWCGRFIIVHAIISRVKHSIWSWCHLKMASTDRRTSLTVATLGFPCWPGLNPVKTRFSIDGCIFVSIIFIS